MTSRRRRAPSARVVACLRAVCLLKIHCFAQLYALADSLGPKASLVTAGGKQAAAVASEPPLDDLLPPLTDALDEETQAFLRDREALNNLIAAVTDAQMSRILASEDAVSDRIYKCPGLGVLAVCACVQVKSAEKARALGTVSRLNKEEMERDRFQVAEILAVYTHGSTQCQEMLDALKEVRVETFAVKYASCARVKPVLHDCGVVCTAGGRSMSLDRLLMAEYVN